MIGFCLSQKEEDKIEEKSDSCIDEHIRSSRYPEYMPDIIERGWNEGKKKQSSSDSEKYEKMQRIESFTTSDIIGCIGYDASWDDEKYLKECHVLRELHRKICRCNITRSAHVSWFCRWTCLHLLILIEWNCWIDWATLDLYIFWNTICWRLVLWSLRSEGTWSKKCWDKCEKNDRSHKGKIKK